MTPKEAATQVKIRKLARFYPCEISEETLLIGELLQESLETQEADPSEIDDLFGFDKGTTKKAILGKVRISRSILDFIFSHLDVYQWNYFLDRKKRDYQIKRIQSFLSCLGQNGPSEKSLDEAKALLIQSIDYLSD